MVSKGKLKIALDAHKGVDYKKKHQEKLVKQSRRAKSSKKPEDDWEDVQSENEDEVEDGEEDDGTSKGESDAEEPIKVSSPFLN